MPAKRTFWDKFWRDEHGREVIWKRPNKLLLAWAGVSFINLFLRGGVVESILGWIGGIAILFWSLIELIWGENYFWHIIGFCVFFIVLFSKFI